MEKLSILWCAIVNTDRPESSACKSYWPREYHSLGNRFESSEEKGFMDKDTDHSHKGEQQRND